MTRKAPAIAAALALGLIQASAAAAAPSPAAPPPADRFEQLIDDSKMSMMTDPRIAHDRASQALGVAREDADVKRRTTRIATAQWLEAEALIRTDRAAAALPIIDEALASISTKQPNTKLHGDLMMARGGARATLGQVQPALADFLAAHGVFRGAGEPRGQAKALQEIGSIYQDAGDYERVLHYYAQSAEAYAADPSLLISAYNNKANALKELHRYPEAIKQYDLALKLARELDSPLLQTHILTNLASTEVVADLLDAADRDIARARSLARQPQVAAELPFIEGVAAQAALRRGRHAEAVEHLKATFAGVDLATSNPAYRDFHEAAYQAYSKLGDDRSALVHLRAFKRIDDDTRSLAASTNAALMAARFDFANQDLKIANLKAGQLQRDVQLARSRNAISMVLLGAAGIVLALLAAGFLSIRRSRNEVRATNVKISHANTALEKALKAKTEFLATTSHEIRTPLNGILGMTQVLLADRRIETDLREKITIVHGAGEAMRALVDDILDVAKMETGHLSISRAKLDLHQVLRETEQMWSQQAETKGLDVSLSIEGAPRLILEDGGRLRQVLSNLMSNAIKFTDAGKVEITARAEPGEDGERLIIEVRDTGIGIPESQYGEAFESFKQLDGGLSRRHAGTGLGLTICRNLVEALGGQITLQSQVGVGSTFTVNLPLQRVADPAAEAAGSGPDGGRRQLSSMTLLLIEANPLAQSVLRALLQDKVRGMEIVSSGTAAFDALSARQYDQILAESGALASGSDSVEAALERLSGAAGSALITMLCPSPTAEMIGMLLDRGARQVLSKPIAGPALIAALDVGDLPRTNQAPDALRA